MTNYNDGPFSIEDAHKNFSYCPESGSVMSASNRRNVHIGDVVGTPDKQGYIITTLFKKPVKCHRLAWALYYDEWPDGMIDHINGMKFDNRISNLRIISNAQNKQNVDTPKSNTSGYMGVSFHKASDKWRATIKLDGKAHHIGTYDTAEMASEAYKRVKNEIHPFNEVYK